MVIYAEKNLNYGGILVTSKYSPLQNIQFDNDSIKDIQTIINHRIQSLKANKLFLFSADWSKFIFIDKGETPIVVVSSNRANVIKDNITDLWYYPNPNKKRRKLIIIVHKYEYHYYAEIIGMLPPNLVQYLMLVAWELGDIVGFGASRFAAIEMAKVLLLRKIWLVDDNVAHISNFPGLNTYEETMDEGVGANENPNKEIIAISFQGATKTLNLNDIKKPADPKAGVSQPGNPQLVGLLQQVVLWNVEYLKNQQINISPYFIDSNEDVSISCLH